MRFQNSLWNEDRGISGYITAFAGPGYWCNPPNSKIIPEKHEKTDQELEIASTGFAVANNYAKTQCNHFRWISTEFRYNTLVRKLVQHLSPVFHRFFCTPTWCKNYTLTILLRKLRRNWWKSNIELKSCMSSSTMAQIPNNWRKAIRKVFNLFVQVIWNNSLSTDVNVKKLSFLVFFLQPVKKGIFFHAKVTVIWFNMVY